MALSLYGGFRTRVDSSVRAYGRFDARVERSRFRRDSLVGVRLGAFAGASTRRTPFQRRIFLSSADPVETFFNHFVRPEGGLLAERDAHFVPLGGAAFRGYDPRVAVRDAAAVNAELLLRLETIGRAARPLTLWGTVWGDLGGVRLAEAMPGGPDTGASVGDAGIGLALRGWIYDREISVRLDAPVFLTHPAMAVGKPGAAPDKFGPRWQVTFGDVW